jgi:hypothetical protein
MLKDQKFRNQKFRDQEFRNQKFRDQKSGTKSSGIKSSGINSSGIRCKSTVLTLQRTLSAVVQQQMTMTIASMTMHKNISLYPI